MEKYEFLKGLEKLEKTFKEGYHGEHRNIIAYLISKKYRLNKLEWENVVYELICDRKILPQIAVIKDYVLNVIGRRDKLTPVKLDCKYCASLGYVWWMNPDKYPHRCVIPCGCDNTPKWDKSPGWKELTLNGRVSIHDLISGHKVPMSTLEV